MRAATTLFLIAAAALLVGAPPAPAQPAAAPPPEGAEAVQREVQAAQEAQARAIAEFEGPQQSRSIVAFDEVIARLEAVGPQALPPRGRDILAEAYEYRGRAYFGIGLAEKASENFRRLVQLKADHALSRERVSPKVVELFNSVKRTLVGYLAVSSKPAGAQVTLVGAGGVRSDLGLTDFFPLEVLAGEYTLEVARPGYQTETRAVSITARDTQTLDVSLVRVLASAFFVTEPAGVEIWVDGELKATTSGGLAPELHEEVRARGIDPARASARTEVANLSLGSHAVELRRKCHETVRRTLEATQPQDYYTDPVKMEDSLASLRLTSDPPGARILLNGEARGVTPAQIDGICSGKVRVEVKHAAGRFIKDLVLGKDEAVSLDCPIRPTLAFLGVEAAGASGERYLEEAEEKIRQNLGQLASLNFIVAPHEAVDRILEQEKTSRMALAPDSGSDPDLVRKVTERLAGALEAQGFLLA
ncbi:MAG TPA: PEGA domain-containing protein, partial [Vicinamibacteria bacterium]|nr:PEGA domain-containing protein [Vicinamibacteria bacterium]